MTARRLRYLAARAGQWLALSALLGVLLALGLALLVTLDAGLSAAWLTLLLRWVR